MKKHETNEHPVSSVYLKRRKGPDRCFCAIERLVIRQDLMRQVLLQFEGGRR